MMFPDKFRSASNIDALGNPKISISIPLHMTPTMVTKHGTKIHTPYSTLESPRHVGQQSVEFPACMQGRMRKKGSKIHAPVKLAIEPSPIKEAHIKSWICKQSESDPSAIMCKKISISAQVAFIFDQIHM